MEVNFVPSSFRQLKKHCKSNPLDSAAKKYLCSNVGANKTKLTFSNKKKDLEEEERGKRSENKQKDRKQCNGDKE